MCAVPNLGDPHPYSLRAHGIFPPIGWLQKRCFSFISLYEKNNHNPNGPRDHLSTSGVASIISVSRPVTRVIGQSIGLVQHLSANFIRCAFIRHRLSHKTMVTVGLLPLELSHVCSTIPASSPATHKQRIRPSQHFHCAHIRSGDPPKRPHPLWILHRLRSTDCKAARHPHSQWYTWCRLSYHLS
jgi:hypothetical protein